jgi:hypothetical protein
VHMHRLSSNWPAACKCADCVRCDATAWMSAMEWEGARIFICCTPVCIPAEALGTLIRKCMYCCVVAPQALRRISLRIAAHEPRLLHGPASTADRRRPCQFSSACSELAKRAWQLLQGDSRRGRTSQLQPPPPPQQQQHWRLFSAASCQLRGCCMRRSWGSSCSSRLWLYELPARSCCCDSAAGGGGAGLSLFGVPERAAVTAAAAAAAVQTARAFHSVAVGACLLALSCSTSC